MNSQTRTTISKSHPTIKAMISAVDPEGKFRGRTVTIVEANPDTFEYTTYVEDCSTIAYVDLTTGNHRTMPRLAYGDGMSGKHCLSEGEALVVLNRGMGASLIMIYLTRSTSTTSALAVAVDKALELGAAPRKGTYAAVEAVLAQLGSESKVLVHVAIARAQELIRAQARA